MTKPIASLSIDFDNKWAYLRAAGRDDWDQVDGYLPLAADRVVDVLGSLGLPLTVFAVGRDFADDENCDAIRLFGGLGGWEIANHSLNHLPWMHTMPADEIADEIEITHNHIVDVTGKRPVGFRGPGFSCPDEVLRVLAKNEYVYDASVFPTSIAPVARAVFMMRTKLEGEQREKAKKLYGGFSSLMNPNRPYRRTIALDRELSATTRQMWEMPVTVMPLTRTPIHFSYFTFLASKSTWLAKAYFRMALAMCRMTGTTPSLLLHPPDFMGREDDADMAYFPAMDMTREAKLSIVNWALSLYAETFEVHTMIDHLRQLDSAVQPQPNATTEPTQPTTAPSFDQVAT